MTDAVTGVSPTGSQELRENASLHRSFDLFRRPGAGLSTSYDNEGSDPCLVALTNRFDWLNCLSKTRPLITLSFQTTQSIATN